ncbi:MAG: hypothetical protein IJP52_00560 [Paludibacteraceae bacterium]|nr:hypothetical protein [Paludibacteraceae bacterium]
MKSLLLSLALLPAMLWAAAGPICNDPLYSQQQDRTDKFAYVNWTTDADGNVNVSIFYDNKTAWRGRGLADDVTSAKGFTLTIGGETKDISAYFVKNYTQPSSQSSAPTVYQLKLKDGLTPFVDVPVGSVIKYVPTSNICWWTAEDNNGWAKKTYEYTYGSDCSSPAGDPITVCARSYKSDTYTGGPTNIDDSEMFLSVNTRADGSVTFSISGKDGDAGTLFRKGNKSDAMSGLSCFTYNGGQSLDGLFTLSGPENAKACVLTPVGDTRLPEGTVISYNGTIQWKTTNYPNAYKATGFVFSYGGACDVMETPSIAAISADSVVTINTVTGAESYLLRIYYNGDLIARYAGVQTGYKIPFRPMATAEYAVTVTAQAVDKDDSEESVPYAWSLQALPYTPAASTVCDLLLVSDTYQGGPTNTDDSKVLLSASTLEDGSVVFSLVLATPAEGQSAAFRKDDALGITSFTVNGAPATSFFATASRDGEATYVLTPIAGHELPRGTVIDYDGTAQWKTTNYPNAYRRNTVLHLVYGDACSGSTTAIRPTMTNETPNAKFLRNGQLIIRHNGVEYNAQGATMAQ